MTISSTTWLRLSQMLITRSALPLVGVSIRTFGASSAFRYERNLEFLSKEPIAGGRS